MQLRLWVIVFVMATACRPPAWSAEIFVNPWVIYGQQLLNRANRDDPLVREHRDPVTNGVERIEIVGNQEYGEAKGFFQIPCQIVEIGSADGIEPSRWFIQKQQLRIHRQSPREASAFAHTAG